MDPDPGLPSSSTASFYRNLTGLPQAEAGSTNAGKIGRGQVIKYGIGSGNVGYKLLKKAGWEEGEGLGPDGKGCTEPLEAWFNRGRRGVGCEDQRREQLPQKNVSVPVKDVKDACRDNREKEKEEALRAAKRRRREAAVRRSFYAECRDADMEIDSNPLLRENRLSIQNPLLED